jgi:aquaporin Z
MTKRLAAELFGTFWLVFAGCGSAVIAASARSGTGFPVGIGYLGVALAFGLTVLTMAYAVGHTSGGHFNPAVTLGLATARRIAWRDVLPYVVTQVAAAIAAAALLWVIASGTDSFPGQAGGFASNGYGDRSPGGYSLLSAALIEVVLTAFFLLVILGSTDTRAPRGFAPLAIGLSLTLIHLVSIPVTNTSVNPARSTGPALFAGADALGQLWLFWLAPLVGGLIAGAAYAWLLASEVEPASLEVAAEA